MNNERRKQIEAIKVRIASLLDLAEEIKSDIESVRDDEQEYFDNMPCSFQEGVRGELSQTAIDELESAISELDCLLNCDIEGALEKAAE